MTGTQEPFLRNHSLRSFLFARAAAEQHGRRPADDYDVELVFLICALHDMGLTEEGNTDQRFEVAGADLAARFLEEQPPSGNHHRANRNRHRSERPARPRPAATRSKHLR